MLEIFRRNRFFNSLLLLPYTILIRIWLVFDGTAPDFRVKGILTDWIFGDLRPDSSLAVLLSIVLVYFQALMLNRIVIRNRVTRELTLFPGLFYILLVSFFPEYNSLSSPLIANTFVIIALSYLMGAHKTTGNAARIFAAGFWFGMAFLFYFGFIVLFLCGMIGLSLLRTVKARELFQYIIGYTAPLVITAMADYLLFDDLSGFAAHFTGQFGFFDIDLPFGLPLFLQLGLFGVIFLMITVNYGRFSLRQNIHVQKKINILYSTMLFMLGVVLVQAHINYEEWTTISLPMACFVAILFIRSSQILILEIIHFALLLTVIGLQINAVL